MHNRSGLTFADVLILIAIVLLLAALAIPRFIKVPDYGNEEDETAPAVTNSAGSGSSSTNTPSPR